MAVPWGLFGDVKFKVSEIYEGIFRSVKVKNRKKLETLRSNSALVSVSTHENTAFFNFTNIEPPERVKGNLCLETKFGLEVRNSEMPISTVIKDLELCIQSVKMRDIPEEQHSEKRNNIRAEAINIITNFHLKPRSNNRSQRDQDAIATKKFLKENRDLIVARSDKGKATVLMHREEYLQVMKRMLADEDTCQRIEKDVTFKLERRANELVDSLQCEGVISEERAKALKTHNSTTPRMYGLRKVHKPGCNLRPVVSCIKAPMYKVARFLHELLVPVSSNSRFSVNNSAEFATFAGGVQLPQGYILASLDVVSLFTNIPKDLVLKIVEDKWEEWSTRVRASKKLVVALEKFCFEGSYFTFDNEL
ncbi:uncharacterized protein LOC107045296 [Diachasma alloeum]|uniref:uncharacterized protein LOC107045296 n=1 Tax=Diachasma alloeum TaxID=454923 RepID=UPI000738494B|nr:uncharacterized protein LOC107045296 [Diachasma alloeum]